MVQTAPSVIPVSFRDLLQSQALAHLATVNALGDPQVNPAWFDFDGAHLRFSLTRTRRKLRNIERNPRVAVSIADPKNPYRYLEIRGVVTDVVDDPDFAFIDLLTRKYLGQEHYPWHEPGDERVIVLVEPLHTTSLG